MKSILRALRREGANRKNLSDPSPARPTDTANTVSCVHSISILNVVAEPDLTSSFRRFAEVLIWSFL
jgi:hypothetical protein